MDINETLNEIIFKYCLDRYYPHYRNMYEAEKILQSLIKEIIQYGKKAMFVGDDRKGIEFIQNMSRDDGDICFLLYNSKDRSLQEMADVDWKQYDEIYIVSFYGAEYVERWFRQHSIPYEWIYDIFERKGIVLQREFFIFGKEDLFFLADPKGDMHSYGGRTESVQCELYCQQSKYNTASNDQTRRIALEKCLFLTLYMRNFVMAHQYSMLLADYDNQYTIIWNEIQDLLDVIKRTIVDRKQKDIILYWLDSIPYFDADSMPHLRAMMNESVVFENAFTYIPYTHPTLRAMFLGKKDIDDQAYNICQIVLENSPVIQLLEKYGYNIRIYSGYFGDYFPRSCQSRHFYTDVCAPISMKLWDMFSDMLLTEQNTLWLVHSLEPHAPYLNARMSDQNHANMGEMRRLARLEVDEQLAFYDPFVGRNAYRIYMSDHGIGTMLWGKIHVLFNIYHRTLKPGKIKGLFSLLDFVGVLEKIIINGEIREDDLSRSYVEIGNLDLYNPRLVTNLFRNKEIINEIYFGYKGIIDQENIYIRYGLGKEWWSPRKDMRNPILFYQCADDIPEPKLLSKYRELAGEFPDELLVDEKFRYSKYLYALYDNVIEHHDVAKRVRLIEQLLEQYPDNSVGVRMGGYHSLVLYGILSKRCRRKLWGFIDNDVECLCSTLPLPIVRSDNIDQLKAIGIQAVLLSSYVHIKALREEAGGWPEGIHVLDIYQCFIENGQQCDADFWLVRGRDEDYDVGISMD